LGREGVGGSSPRVETVHGWAVAMSLGPGRRCGDRGVEDGAALRDFGGALRHAPPSVFQRHPGVAPGRPHVRFTNAEGSFGHRLEPPRAFLREDGPFGEGGRGAARARLAEVLEVALERPPEHELELGLIQTQMAQKPMLRALELKLELKQT
jgi:hypothetical protein